MKIQTTISLITATALAFMSLSAAAQGHQQHGAKPQDRAQIERGQRDFDRDRMRDRDRLLAPQRDRDQDRIHAPGNAKLGDSDIYGYELMSVQERARYREQLKLTDSDPQAQARFKAQHAEKMRSRAKAQGVTLNESPKQQGKN